MMFNLPLELPAGSVLWNVEGKTYGDHKICGALLVERAPENGGAGHAKASFLEEMLRQHIYLNPVTLTATLVSAREK